MKSPKAKAAKRVRKEKIEPPVDLTHLFACNKDYFAVRTSGGIICFDKEFARPWAYFLACYADWADAKARKK